eukprot:scaffold731_cov261-Pinguiococcus_pyrenoidosus.AAC.4
MWECFCRAKSRSSSASFPGASKSSRAASVMSRKASSMDALSTRSLCLARIEKTLEASLGQLAKGRVLLHGSQNADHGARTIWTKNHN